VSINAIRTIYFRFYYNEQIVTPQINDNVIIKELCLYTLKKRTDFETFGDIWQIYSKDYRIEFARFSVYVSLLLKIDFSFFKPDTENNRIFLTLCQANVPILTRCNF